MSVSVPRRLQPEALRRKRDEHREPTKRSFILNLNFVKKAPQPAAQPEEVPPIVEKPPPIVEEPKPKVSQKDESKIEKKVEKQKEDVKTKRKETKALSPIIPSVLEQSVDYLPPSPLPPSPLPSPIIAGNLEASISTESTENGVSSLPELDALLDHSFDSMFPSPTPPEKPSIRQSPPKSKPQAKPSARPPSPKSKRTEKSEVRQPSPPPKVQEKPTRQTSTESKRQEKIRQPSPPPKQRPASPKKSKPAPVTTKEPEPTKTTKAQPIPTRETARPRPPSPKEQPPSPRHKPKQREQAPPSPKSKPDDRQQITKERSTLAKTTHEEPKDTKKKEVFKRKEKRKGEDVLGGGGKRRKMEATENGEKPTKSSKDLTTITTTTKTGGLRGIENGVLGVPKKKRKPTETSKGDAGPAPKRKKAQPRELDLILDAIVDTITAFDIKEKGRINKEVNLLMEGITDELSTQEEQYKKLKSADSKGKARVKKLRHKLLKMEKKRIARDFEMLNKKKELERLEEERKRMEGLHSFLSDMDLLSEFAPKTDAMQEKVCTLEGTVMRAQATIQSANSLKGIIKDFRGCLKMLDYYITRQNNT